MESIASQSTLSNQRYRGVGQLLGVRGHKLFDHGGGLFLAARDAPVGRDHLDDMSSGGHDHGECYRLSSRSEESR